MTESKLKKLAKQYMREDDKKKAENPKGEIIPQLIRNENGSIKKLLANLKIMIAADPYYSQVKYDEFTGRYMLKGREVTDDDIEALRSRIDEKHLITFTRKDVSGQLNLLAKRKENTYHPIKEFIEAQEWDQVKRVETLFIDYLGAEDNAYTRQVAKRWLTGAVARIYEPGIKFEIVPILQGPQGIGKSTLPMKLGGDYYTASLRGMGRQKDDFEQLRGKWIVELGELASMNSTEVETVKNFISERVDHFRPSYAERAQSFPRTCVFIGTTNIKEYLKDLTGNRRFFPIPCSVQHPKKDVFKLSNDTIGQIWAEAMTYYKAGEKLYFDSQEKELLELIKEHQAQATSKSYLVETLETYLEMPVPADWHEKTITDKRIHWNEYLEEDVSEIFNDTSEFIELDKVTINELNLIVGNLITSDRGASSRKKQIKMYMDSLENWEYKKSIRFGPKKNTSGYQKIK